MNDSNLVEVDVALVEAAKAVGKEFGREVGAWCIMELPKDVTLRTDGLVDGYKRKLMEEGEPELVAQTVAFMMGNAMMEEVATLFALADHPAGHA